MGPSKNVWDVTSCVLLLLATLFFELKIKLSRNSNEQIPIYTSESDPCSYEVTQAVTHKAQNKF